MSTPTKLKPLVCPKCKNEDRLAEKASLIGYCAGYFTVDAKGNREFEAGGYTDIDWDTYTALTLHCECGWTGPIEELIPEEQES